MATTIVIICPECKKEMKAPAELAGKKIRCKGCGSAVLVKAAAPSQPAKAAAPPKPAKAGAAAKTAAPPPAAKKPARPKPAKKHADADADDDGNPYDVTHLDLAPRCPNCANEMEDEEAVICLNCGYNTQTRAQAKTEKTIANTGGDYFLWLLPGVVRALVCLGGVGFIIFLVTGPLQELAKENEEAWWNFGIKAMQLWGTIVTLFVMFFTGKFALKRLAFNIHPPEKKKK